MADKREEDTLVGASDSGFQANNNFSQEVSGPRHDEEKKRI